MERIDDTGFGGIKVIQTRGSGYGVDAVLLAAFAAGETGAGGLQKNSAVSLRVADLGTGCGVIAFIMHHKLGGAKLTGYDINPAAIERAVRACDINGLAGDIGFVCTDIKDIDALGEFDAVLTNPPYFRRTPDEPGAADPDERYIARHETTADIADFARTASAMLKNGGSLYMIHRPDRLADIITEMRAGGIEPKEMQFVVPSAGRAANMVLIHGVRGAGPELRMLPEIAVHAADGGYTEEIVKYYERD
ncbi:MAG: methyltransferase domain-containing protein [Clostridiales bacterium]|nr:methyltransferase domain-containing protein [Clostridiales bacterium]